MNWIIERLYVKPSEDGLSNVVISADWRCNGNQGQYNGTCYGSCQFGPPDPTDFTAYDSLTLDQVLGWCFNQVDKAGVETNVNKQIADLINPPIVSPALPWATNTP